MFKEYFLIYLLGHILGDYYFQNEQLAELKNKEMDKLMQHSCIYLITYIVVILPIFSPKILLSAIVISIIHAGVDLGKCLYIKYFPKSNLSVRKLYIFDQVIHLACLAIVAYVMTVNKTPINVILVLNNIFSVINIGEIKILSWLIMVLFIFKPANITIKQLLSTYKPNENTDKAQQNDRRTGAFIGSLERLIILIFLSMNQFSAIGLVLTAKSVARYNKIVEDKDFAEYYLLGTLLSTVLVIIMFMVIY